VPQQRLAWSNFALGACAWTVAGDVSFWSSTCFPFHHSKTVRFIEDVNVTVINPEELSDQVRDKKRFIITGL
jgi:hypothetical protein